MARIKSGKPIRKERLLQVLTNGGLITKRQIELTMKYQAMYRIPTELWKLKKMGAIIKSHKDGRKVVGYELLNVDEMTKLLTSLGFATLPLVSEDSDVKTLSDLKAKPAKAKASNPVKVDALVIEDEVTEVTE